jgi:hypothetical protein
MLQGIYAVWKWNGDEVWLNIVRRVARTIVKWGSFKADDGWWLCNNVHYPSVGAPPLSYTANQLGDPLPADWYKKDSTLVNHARGGVATWTFPAFLMFIETVEDENDPDLPRAREVVEQWTGGSESPNPRTAEWWACVKSTVDTQAGGYKNYNV